MCIPKNNNNKYRERKNVKIYNPKDQNFLLVHYLRNRSLQHEREIYGSNCNKCTYQKTITINTKRERERERERESFIKYPGLLWCKSDVNGNVNGFHNTTDCVCSNKKDFIRFK